MTEQHTSAYERIAAALEQRITSGELAPGERLPFIPDIARAEGVSEMPVRMAFRLLHRKGLIESRGRGGTRVAAPTPPLHLSADRYRRSSTAAAAEPTGATSRIERRLEHLQADTDLAELFATRTGTRLRAQHLTIHADNTPPHLTVSYLRWADIARTPLADEQTAGTGPVRAELESIGLRPAVVTERFTYGEATPGEATALNLGPGIAVVRCTRRHLTADGRVVEVGRLTYRADTLIVENSFPLDDEPPRGSDRRP
ncbi:GntR family transcriptional regulator [Streptomyces nanshensis]|uniref:HTH gntR-type domain-containing protein n=1 Tax=Streptomyces nanshensis TaxID=518642 RepID=A0A1E7L176_9ACTN|nr:GntR family transcriptional regulator [Streptomyces nanshensis]OEV09930.1 hypothetical protein AN218_19850 [Streptomyces nanshensis]